MKKLLHLGKSLKMEGKFSIEWRVDKNQTKPISKSTILCSKKQLNKK